jgi:hypothetical protein
MECMDEGMALISNAVDTIEPIHFILPSSSFTFLDIHLYTYTNVIYLSIYMCFYIIYRLSVFNHISTSKPLYKKITDSENIGIPLVHVTDPGLE